MRSRATVLFVCKGNIHRSVVAEICLKQELKKMGLGDRFEVMSRGIQGCCGTEKPEHQNLTHYETQWSLTKPILGELGVDLSGISSHVARPVGREDIQKADIVYAMELVVLGKSSEPLPNSLLAQFPEYSSKMHFFGDIEGNSEELPDCGDSGDLELYYLVNERIVHAIRVNIQRIIDNAKKGETSERLKNMQQQAFIFVQC